MQISQYLLHQQQLPLHEAATLRLQHQSNISSSSAASSQHTPVQPRSVQPSPASFASASASASSGYHQHEDGMEATKHLRDAVYMSPQLVSLTNTLRNKKKVGSGVTQPFFIFSVFFKLLV